MSNHATTYHLLDNEGNHWAECEDEDKARELAARQGLYVSEVLTYDPEELADYTPDEDGETVNCYFVEEERSTGLVPVCVSRYCTQHHKAD